MNLYLRISLLLGIALYFICIFGLLKKNNLNLKYTLAWIVMGILMMLVVIFPDIIRIPLNVMGIVEWTNGIFALMILFLIILSMIVTAIVSKMNERNRKLIQQCALYEERIRLLEKKMEKL